MHHTDPTPQQILAQLVALPCLPGQPNDTISAAITAHLQGWGLRVHRILGPEGDRSNLFASIGPVDQPGIILSGHMDVVPVAGQDWTSDPFRLTARDGRLYGRGTTDMKGFVACMIAAVPMFQKAALRGPIHLALSYDEEIGCRGAPHLIAALPDLCAKPKGCIVGEPSAMQPVLSHKGKLAVKISFTGRAAHSSDPAAGINALYAGAALALQVQQAAAALAQDGPHDARFSPDYSTLVAGILQAGDAVNIIPERAAVTIEVRTIPDQSADDLIAPIIAAAAELVRAGAALSYQVTELARYPALPPDAQALAARVGTWTGHSPRQSVSYGTEAGLFHAAGIASVICGPGDISRAHRPDEYITGPELDACMAMLAQLAATLR